MLRRRQWNFFQRWPFFKPSKPREQVMKILPPSARAHVFEFQRFSGSHFGSTRKRFHLSDSERKQIMRGFLIGILVVAVGVLGYLYYQDQQDSVSIELEAPEVTTN